LPPSQREKTNTKTIQPNSQLPAATETKQQSDKIMHTTSSAFRMQPPVENKPTYQIAGMSQTGTNFNSHRKTNSNKLPHLQ
jgi:hypothetical protein